MRIAVYGLGYVGSVTAAYLLKHGHTIVGVDTDESKLDAISRGLAPVPEPGTEGMEMGLYTAPVAADLALICVGTPATPMGSLNTAAVASCVEGARERGTGHIVVRSTVPVGTCDDLAQTIGQPVHFWPEFSREGRALADMEHPLINILGVADSSWPWLCMPGEPVVMGTRTAELTKLASNALHAVKASFANEVGHMASRLGANGGQVMHSLAMASRQQGAGAYMRPGFAWGGPCLPKDVGQMIAHSSGGGTIGGAAATNMRVLMRAYDAVKDCDPTSVLVIGAGFKQGSADRRNSPVMRLADMLRADGVSVTNAHADEWLPGPWDVVVRGATLRSVIPDGPWAIVDLGVV